MACLALSWSNTLLRTLLDAPCLRKWEYKLFLSLCELQKLLHLILLMILSHALHRFSHAFSSHFTEENSLGTLCRSLEFSLCSFIICFPDFCLFNSSYQNIYIFYLPYTSWILNCLLNSGGLPDFVNTIQSTGAIIDALHEMFVCWNCSA